LPNPQDMEAAWLKAELEKPGRSQSALGRFLKLDPAIVNRMCGGGNGRTISSKEADQIRIYLAATARGAPMPAGGAVEGVPEQSIAEIAMLPVRRTIQAGAFLAVSDMDQRPPRLVAAAPNPHYPKSRQLLSRVVGDSMDMLNILENDLVHMVDVWAIPAYAPRSGDIVEVERSRMDGREIEVTLKQVVVTTAATELWPRSSNPLFQEALELRHGLMEDEELHIRIVGKMLTLIRSY
jgi:hypothetical protein